MPSCAYCGKPIINESSPCPACGTIAKPGEPIPRQPPTPTELKERRCVWRRLGGFALFSVGLLASIASYQSAAASGASKFRYFPWLIVAGLILFFFPSAAASDEELEEDPNHLLDRAAALEGKDSKGAMNLYADIIRRFPKSTAAEEARRNVIALSQK